MTHTNTHIWQTIEEHSILDFKLLTLLTNIKQDIVHTLVCVWNKVILNKEATNRYHRNNDKKWLKYAHKRQTRRLHRQQLEVLAKVTHSHNRREQHRQRQAQWNHIDRTTDKQLCNGTNLKSLTRKLINVSPYEVQHQDKLHDKEYS